MSHLRVAIVALVFASAFLLPRSAEAQSVPPTAQIRSPHSGLCAEPQSGSINPGVRIVQADCAADARQQWSFRAGAGGYEIVSRKSGLCLSINGGSQAQGTPAVQLACSGADSQRWTVRLAGAALNLVAAHSGQCLEIGNGATSSRAPLNQWNCVDVPQNKWTLPPVAPPVGMIVNRNSSMCAQVPNGNTADGTQLTQFTCLASNHLQWELRPSGDAFQLVNRNSGKCASVEGSSTADGAKIVQWRCENTADNGRWRLRQKGDYVDLVAAHSGKCMDVNGGSIDDGAAVIQWPCRDGANQHWTIAAQSAASAWSGVVPFSIVPVAAATLRNGKIMTWSAYDRFAFGGDQGKTYTSLFDPATGAATEKLVTNTGHDMFCPGTTMLGDGRIMVTGGSSSSKASVFNPNTNTWTTTTPLNVPRGYQGDTLLSTGEVFTVGGSWSGGQGGKVGEVFKIGAGWRRLSGVTGESMAGVDPGGIYRADNHMWLYGTANGSVFHAGPSAAMHWVDTAGNGAVASAGPRGDDPYSMNGNVVMYEPGKLLKMGGAPAYQDAKATNAAYTIDFSRGPAQPVTVARQKPMTFQRAFANAVALPNGEVVVVGGQTLPIPFSDARPVMYPEIWSPATGAFSPLAQMAVPRAYHSVATLMLDGRVFVGGGGLCGGCATNHPNAEILTPPYLLNADGSPAVRPSLGAAPKTAAPGETIEVRASGNTRSFAMVRLSSTTHSVNNDQRRLPLSSVDLGDGWRQLNLPADRGVMLPGDWMLFAMTAKGAPSVAKVIRVR